MNSPTLILPKSGINFRLRRKKLLSTAIASIVACSNLALAEDGETKKT